MKSGRVYGLDEQFNIIHEYKYIEFEWVRKYYDAGEFTLYCMLSQYNPNAKYVIAEGREGIGIAQKMEYTASLSGEFVTIQGFFLEKKLDYYGTNLGYSFKATSNFSTQLASLLTSLGVNDYTIVDSYEKKIDTSFDAFMFLGESLRSVLQSEEMSYSLSSDNVITFWQGADNGVTFAKEAGNVNNLSYTEDVSNIRTKCVGYINVGADASDYDVKNNITGDRYVTSTYGDGDTFVSAEFQVDSNETTYTNAQLRSQIQTSGKVYLLDFAEENTIEMTPIQSDSCCYMVHYNLGDKVRISTSRLGVEHTSRIVEVTELWKNNMSEIKLTIGNTRRIKR